MKILAIESSADETAAAVVEDGVKILSNVIASSTAMHQKYGGIVPEVAARKHIESIIPVLTEATQGIDKKDIDAIAVTIGPGLIGSLLIGVETAKTLALVWNKPIIPVNHVLAHMYANFVMSENEAQNSSRAKSRDFLNISSRLSLSRAQSRDSNNKVMFPAISLVVSGGHTELYFMKNEKELIWLGGTLDDAAGEAFDKTARLLGFENRGGPAVAAAAAKFQISNFKFQIKLPRPMIHDDTLNFSFSGLKAAILREVKKSGIESVRHSGDPAFLKNSMMAGDSRIRNKNGSWTSQDDKRDIINAFAFEAQEAITDVLVSKTLTAAEKFNVKSILLSGGVAANLRLREKFQVSSLKFQVVVPEVLLCTDNAVYIGSYAFFRGKPVAWQKINAEPDLSVEVTK